MELGDENKICPACGAPSHKVDGCLYVTCYRKECRANWCWACGQYGGGTTGRPQPHHVYECADPVNQEWIARMEGRGSDNDEQRFLFFYTRYKAHEASQRFAGRLRARTNQMLQASRKQVVELQFLLDAVEVLFECRVCFEHNEREKGEECCCSPHPACGSVVSFANSPPR